MTESQVKKAVAFYQDFMTRHMVPNIKCTSFNAKSVSSEVALAHAHSMLDEIDKMLVAGRLDRASSLLHFAQGILWTLGEFSLEELNSHNRSI